MSEDGLTITSDSGVGVIKAGWHCAGNPSATGTCEPVSVRIDTQGPLLLAPGIVGATEMVTAEGTPAPGSYSWTSSDGSAIEFVSGQTASTVTIRLLEPKEVTLRVKFTAESGAPSNVATIQVIPVAMKLEQVGDTVISKDANGNFVEPFSEDTTVRVTAVNAETGATLTNFTGEVQIEEMVLPNTVEIYSQNGGELPASVTISGGGTTEFEAKSLAGPPDDGGNQKPNDAVIITTNYPVRQADPTKPPRLVIAQWVDNIDGLHSQAIGPTFDWFEARMLDHYREIVSSGGEPSLMLLHVEGYRQKALLGKIIGQVRA